jgi:hypothetical protein
MIQPPRPATGQAVRAALLGWLIAALLFLAMGWLGGRFGQEPRSAWVCDDTRYTQLVPRGREVVGPPVSPAPGCAP